MVTCRFRQSKHKEFTKKNEDTKPLKGSGRWNNLDLNMNMKISPLKYVCLSKNNEESTKQAIEESGFIGKWEFVAMCFPETKSRDHSAYGTELRTTRMANNSHVFVWWFPVSGEHDID